MAGSLPVINLAEAKFECIYGRGCDGICCKNGRPGVYPDELERIENHLDKFLPHLRPEALEVIAERGYLSNRKKQGLPMLRVVEGWCVFFNQGCVLHKVGAMEGDKYLYKPAVCALFPLGKDERNQWYVRQKGLNSESWNLFCLDPNISRQPAAESLQEEIELAYRYTLEAEEAVEPAAVV
jgi:hypothetical protein